MNRELRLSDSAQEALRALERIPHQEGLLKQIRKVLLMLETNPRHPSLQTHKFRSLRGPKGEEAFEACVQQHTPGAYRVFFYGPDRMEGKHRIAVVTVFAITPHP
jgi:hypothetical protein